MKILLLGATGQIGHALTRAPTDRPGPLRPIVATTDHSVPVPRVGTLSLAGAPLVPFPLHRDRRFPQFSTRARTRMALPLCRTSHGQ